MLWDASRDEESNSTVGAEVRCCAILQTCKALFEEVSVHLYKNEVLIFHIDHHYPNLRISTARNPRSWELRLEDTEKSSLQYLPYRRLQGIRFIIESPDLCTGRVVLLKLMIRDIVDLLSKHDELPNIDNQLEGEDGYIDSWLLRDLSFLFDNVYETVLVQFARLRNVRGASIHFGEHFDPEDSQPEDSEVEDSGPDNDDLEKLFSFVPIECERFMKKIERGMQRKATFDGQILRFLEALEDLRGSQLRPFFLLTMC